MDARPTKVSDLLQRRPSPTTRSSASLTGLMTARATLDRCLAWWMREAHGLVADEIYQVHEGV